MFEIPKIMFSLEDFIHKNAELVESSQFSLSVKNLGLHVIYSKLNNNYLLLFNNSNSYEVNITEGNQVPFINVGSESSNVQFADLTIESGNQEVFKISRMIYLNEQDFLYFVNQPSEFMETIIYALEVELPAESKKDKLKILDEFKTLLSVGPSELEIDKFIETNPFILEYGLHISDLHHQVILKNLEEDFEQNLKPDVIAWQNLEKRWVIIDYKKYDKKLVKKPWRARSGLMAEVRDLESQLRDYIDYFFRSKIQSDHVLKEYGYT